jgi:MoaA/NifB/PqqE/SkfB family radical SAM enzyme
MKKLIKFGYSQTQNILKKNISIHTNLLLSKPMQVSIQPNERCNARCIMCDSWKETKDYISKDEIIGVLSDLNDWVGNNFFVQIAGGEPLIYKGIFDIFSFCSDKKIITKISTNGISLTENICDKIIESGLQFLSVSLDSHLPEIHDKYRGVPGTFEKAVKGIEYLSANGKLTLGISSLLMKENVSSFPETVEYFLSLPLDRFLFQPIRVWTEDLKPENWKEYEYWVNDEAAVKRTIEYLLEKKKTDARIFNSEQDIQDLKAYFNNPLSMVDSDNKKCYIGYDRIIINYKGDVTLGCARYGSVGNIKEQSIKEMWHSNKAAKIRKQMTRCKLPCTSNCYKQTSLKQKIKKVTALKKSGLFR